MSPTEAEGRRELTQHGVLHCIAGREGVGGNGFYCDGRTKGVGPGPTLAWPGWKQPDISVKVDTARLEAGQFKNVAWNVYYCKTPVLNSRVLLMYTDTVKELPGYPVQSWNF